MNQPPADAPEVAILVNMIKEHKDSGVAVLLIDPIIEVRDGYCG